MASTTPIGQGIDPLVASTPTARRGVRSRLRGVVRRLSQNPFTLFGTIVIIIFIFLAIFGPIVAPYSFDGQDIDNKLQAPSAQHWFGTDNFGRDVMSRVIYGCRDILSLAGLGTLIAVVLGTTLGLVVTYRGGFVEEATMRLMDSLLSLPASLLALLLLGAVGPSRESVLLVIIIVYIPIVARVVRSVVLDVKTKGFVEAAKMRHEGHFYILTREILPSVLPALVVEASFRFAYAIFLVATLGFLGVGVQPPAPDWGLMVSDARNYSSSAPWMLFFPCAAIAVLVISVNLMSDGLKQILQSNTGRE